MTGAEVDELRATEDSRAWEEINSEDPREKIAVVLLNNAIKLIEEVEQYLQDAAYAVEETPEQDRLESLKTDAADLEIEVRMQRERMK